MSRVFLLRRAARLGLGAVILSLACAPMRAAAPSRLAESSAKPLAEKVTRSGADVRDVAGVETGESPQSAAASTNDGQSGEPHGASAHHPDTLSIEGRLSTPSLAAPDGANVTVYQIRDDGRLAPVSNSVVVSDEKGRYRIDIAVTEDPNMDLLVRADNEFGYALTVVPTQYAIDKTIPARPMTDATTVEAQIYLSAKVAGVWPTELGVGRLHGLISDALAHAALHDRDYAAAVGILGRASAAAAKTWSAALATPAVGVRTEQLNATYAALDWSHLTLSSGLNNARSPQEAQLARADFQAGVPLIYGLAAIRPQQLAHAAQATATIFEVYTRALKGDGAGQAFLDMEMLRAEYVVPMVNEAFAQLGDVATRRAVRSCGDTFLLRLAHVQGAPARVQAAVRDAWADYEHAVLDCLKQTKVLDTARLEAASKRLQEAAQGVGAALSKMDPTASPQDAAAFASHAIADLVAAETSQAGQLSPERPASAATALAVVGNLALAAHGL